MILVNNRHEESKEVPEKEIFCLIKKSYFLKSIRKINLHEIIKIEIGTFVQIFRNEIGKHFEK